ncbi:hypothetical protein HYQ46_001396 [Verticillium longisporum]|nr:hypothetical protein HYQ46_001396 [Verticillium longisporum]
MSVAVWLVRPASERVIRRNVVDGVFTIGGLRVDVLKVIEVSAASRDTLFDAIDDIARDVQAVFDVDVSTADAVDDPGNPEEQ